MPSVASRVACRRTRTIARSRLAARWAPTRTTAPSVAARSSDASPAGTTRSTIAPVARGTASAKPWSSTDSRRIRRPAGQWPASRDAVATNAERALCSSRNSGPGTSSIATPVKHWSTVSDDTSRRPFAGSRIRTPRGPACSSTTKWSRPQWSTVPGGREGRDAGSTRRPRAAVRDLGLGHERDAAPRPSERAEAEGVGVGIGGQATDRPRAEQRGERAHPRAPRVRTDATRSGSTNRRRP